MDGKFPSWNTLGGHSCGVTYKILRECQGTNDDDDAHTHCGDEATVRNYGESFGDFTVWPQKKDPELMTVNMSVGDGSSYKYSALQTYSADCQFTPTGMEADPREYSYLSVNQSPCSSDIGGLSEDYELRKEDDAKYHLLRITPKDQELESSTWTSVIKEALEMSNGLGIEQDLAVDTCSRHSVVFEDHNTKIRRTNPEKELHINHMDISPYYWRKVSESDVRIEKHRGEDSSQIGSTDVTNKPWETSNQDIHCRTTFQEETLMTHNTLVNDKGPKKRVKKHSKVSKISNKSRSVRFGLKQQEILPNSSRDSSCSSENGEDALTSSAPLLGQMLENRACGTGKGQSRFLEDANPDKCMNRQIKVSEEYCFEASNETIARNLTKLSNIVNINVTQGSDIELDGQSLGKNIDHTTQNLNITHNGLITDVAEQLRVGNTSPHRCSKQCEKSNLTLCDLDNTLIKTSSEHSTTSVGKQEDVESILNKVIHLSPKPFQSGMDTTNGDRSSNLHSFPERCIKNTDAECMSTKEASPIALQTNVKKHKKTIKRTATCVLYHDDSTGTNCSTQPALSMEYQESIKSPVSVPKSADLCDETQTTNENILNTLKIHSPQEEMKRKTPQSCIQRNTVEEHVVSASTPEVVDTVMEKKSDSRTIQATENMPQKFKSLRYSTRTIPGKIKELKSESSAEQVEHSGEQTSCGKSQKSKNCESVESQVKCKNTETRHQSLDKLCENESLNECDRLATDVRQGTKKKQNKPRKRNAVSEVENSQVKIVQSSSVLPCKSATAAGDFLCPSKSTLQTLPISPVPEIGFPNDFSSENTATNIRNKGSEVRNASIFTSSQKEDDLSLAAKSEDHNTFSKADTTVKAKCLGEKASEAGTSRNLTSNSCNISEPAKCISVSQSCCQHSSTKKSKKRKQSDVKNKNAPVSPDELPTPTLSEEVSSTSDVNIPNLKYTGENIPNTPKKLLEQEQRKRKEAKSSIQGNRVAQNVASTSTAEVVDSEMDKKPDSQIVQITENVPQISENLENSTRNWLDHYSSQNSCAKQQISTKKSKKIKQSKVKHTNGPSAPDGLSHPAQILEVTNTTDVNIQGSKMCMRRNSNQNVKGLETASTDDYQTELKDMVNSDKTITAHGVPNTLKIPRKKDISSMLKEENEKSIQENHTKTPDLPQKLPDFSIIKTSEEHSGGQKEKGVKKKVKQSQKVTGPAKSSLCSEMLPTKGPNVSEIKSESGEISVITKKSKRLVGKNTVRNVKMESVSDPQSYCEFPVTSCEKESDENYVSVKAFHDKDSELAEHECKTDKHIKCPAIKNERNGCPFTKKMASVFQVLQNPTLQNMQEVSSGDLMKTNEKSEETKIVSPVRRSSRIQKNVSESVKSCSSVSVVPSDICDHPVKHEQPKSQAIVEIEHSEKFSSEGQVCSPARDSFGRRRPPNKKKKSRPSAGNLLQPTTLLAVEKTCNSSEHVLFPSEINADPCKSTLMQKNVSEMSKENISELPMDCVLPLQLPSDCESGLSITSEVTAQRKEIARPCRKSEKLTMENSSQSENTITESSISSPAKMDNLSQDGLTHGGKRNKKTKIQASNITVASLRYSRRLSKAPPDYYKSEENPDLGAVDDILNSPCQTTLSQVVSQKDIKEPGIHSKKENIQCRINIIDPLPNENSCEVIHICQLTTEHVEQKSNEDDLIVADRVCDNKESKKEKMAMEKDIPLIKKQKLNTEETVSHQAAKSESEKTECKKRTKTSKPNVRKVSCRNVLDLHPNSVQFKTSKTDILLNCFKDTLKPETCNDDLKLKDVKMSSAMDFPETTGTNKTHVNTDITDLSFDLPTNPSVENNNLKQRDSRTKNEETLNIEINNDGALEFSCQSSVNSAESHSNKNRSTVCGKNVKKEKTENLLSDANVKISEKQGSELSPLMPGTDGATASYSSEAKVAGKATAPPVEEKPKEEMCVAATTVKSIKKRWQPKRKGKKRITCKYCGALFRRISTYTIHLHTHAGEKPYKCKTCGKSFAHLAKLKSHRSVHMQPAELLQCPCCSKTFSQKKHLISHFKTHLQDQKAKLKKYTKCRSDVSSVKPLKSSKTGKSLVCKICGENFSSKCMWEIHMNMHGRENLLSCVVCGKQFKKPLHLVAHERTHWPVKPYACSICGKGFSKLKALKRHSLDHTGYAPFSCFHCGQAFCDLSALRLHQISKECTVKNRLNDVEGFLVSQGVDGQVNIPVFFKCQVCKQLCRKWCQYTLHLQTHTKCPPYLCFACGQSYGKGSDFGVHCEVCCQSSGEAVACAASLSEIMQSGTQNYTYTLNKQIDNVQSPSNNLNSAEDLTSQASYVEKTSSSPVTVPNDAQLPVHLCSSPTLHTPSVISIPSSNDSVDCMKISPSPKRFQCPRCGQQHERYRALCAHMKTHAPGFKFVCQRCGKPFEKWNHFWLHQRIHCTKGHGFSCSQCSVQFHFLGSYREHMLKHAEERPFSCPLCPEFFVDKEDLRAHQCEFHQLSKRLQCDVCSKSFSNLRNLVRHSLLHEGAISHHCLTCNLSFTNGKLLQIHLKAHHKPLTLPLPDISTEPLTFPHKCRRCNASFSTGDLLYAHQICHLRDLKNQVCPTHITESTSSVSEARPQPCSRSTCRPLASSLNLGSIPDDASLYRYPHPDQLYLTSGLSGVRLQIVNHFQHKLSTSCGSSNANRSISGLAESAVPESAQDPSEPNTSQLPQAVQSPVSGCFPSQAKECLFKTYTNAVSNNVQDKKDLKRPLMFAETNVVLEGPAPLEDNERYECIDCSEQINSLAELHEHHFVHALGSRYMHTTKMFH